MFSSTERAELTLTPSLYPAKNTSLCGHLVLAGLAIAAVLADCGAQEAATVAMKPSAAASNREAAPTMWVAAYVGVPENAENAEDAFGCILSMHGPITDCGGPR